jgi:hypothetical protein
LRAWRKKLYERICLLSLFFLAAAASFNGYYGKWHFREAGTGQYMANGAIDAILDGTACRPFVYRQLLPMTAKWIDSEIPEGAKTRMLVSPSNGGPTFLSRLIDSPLARDRTWFLRYWIVYALAFLSAWVAAAALFELGKAFGFPAPAAALGAIGFLLLVPYLLTVGGYFYDYPELAFCAVTAWMAIRCGWWWMVPVAAVATWNKETFPLFVLMLYPLMRVRHSRIAALTGTGVTVAACAGVDALLWARYGHNPSAGQNTLDRLSAHVHFLTHFFSSPFREATYGLPENAVFLFLLLALIAWTALRGWGKLPLPARGHAKIGLAVNVPLYVLFCQAGELRDFGLLGVALFLLMTVNLSQWVGNWAEAKPAGSL